MAGVGCGGRWGSPLTLTAIIALISCSVVVPQSSLGSGGHYVINAITAEARDEVGQIIEIRKRMQRGAGRAGEWKNNLESISIKF